MRPHSPRAEPCHQRWQHMLLAALLLCAQMLLALHALGHLDATNTDRCDVCLVGHALGHGHGIADSSPPVVTAPQITAPTCDVALAEGPAPRPCQRGPPHALRIA